MIAQNGRRIANLSPQLSLTQAEYEALSTAEKNNGTNYFITDADDTDHENIATLLAICGSRDILASMGDGTICGAIQTLYNQLGHFTFNLNQLDNTLQAIYDDSQVVNPLPTLDPDATDAEKIAYLQTIVGDTTKLASTGHDTIATALRELFVRLAGLTWSYNMTQNTATISAETEDED